jgi:hypothetical protein
MVSNKRMVLFAIVFLVTFVGVQAAEFIYVPWMDAYVDKSRLSMRWGLWGDNLALQVTVGGWDVGIAFSEKAVYTEKLNAARTKLVSVLNGKDNDLTDLAKKIGLTFAQLVNYESIIPNVITQ